MSHFETYEQFRLRRELKAARQIPFSIRFLKDAFISIMPNDLILIGAKTGAGKTQIGTALALDAAKHCTSVHYFALEADKEEIEDRLVYSELATIFFKEKWNVRFPWVQMRYSTFHSANLPKELAPLEKQAFTNVKNKTSGLNTIYKDKFYTVDDFVRDFQGVKDESRLVIIDHLHFFDLGKNEKEYEGLRRAIKTIRAAAMDHDVPIILLAQLRKGESKSAGLPSIDDFHGHSDIVRTATSVLLLSRAPQTERSKVPTYVQIAKARHAGDTVGYAGVLNYDLETGSYEREYQIARVSGSGEPKILGAKGEMPLWAKSAMETIF